MARTTLAYSKEYNINFSYEGNTIQKHQEIEN